MDDDVETELPPTDSESRHDPLMTAFVATVIVLLLLVALLIVIANSRPPAGL